MDDLVRVRRMLGSGLGLGLGSHQVYDLVRVRLGLGVGSHQVYDLVHLLGLDCEPQVDTHVLLLGAPG